jgi:hypothetical protein
VRSSDSQNSATPENFVCAAIEGPSSEGFCFCPTYGIDQEGVRAIGGRGTPTLPYIYPDGESRDWTLDYHPDGNGGTGSITVTLHGQAVPLNLDPGHKAIGAHLNRCRKRLLRYSPFTPRKRRKRSILSCFGPQPAELAAWQHNISLGESCYYE